MNPISLEDIVHRNVNLTFSKIDNEVVMMNLKYSQYVGLDPVGSVIWDKLDKPVKIRDIVSDLTDEYNVSFDECAKDTIDFIRKLMERELVLKQIAI